MSGPAQATETEKVSQTAFEGKPDTLDPTKQPVTPGQIQQQTAEKISGNLSQTGYPTTTKQVLPDGEANTVLAEMERSGIGAKMAEVGELIQDASTKVVGNVGAEIAGSKLHYSLPGEAGHKLTMERAGKKAILTGMVQKVAHFLGRFKKPKQGV